MTPVEIIALVVIVAAAIKMLVLLVKPTAWMDFAKRFYSRSDLARIVSLILAAIVLYYLTQAGITIVQILAVTAFVALLIVVGLAPNIGSIMNRYKAQIKSGKLWKTHWFYALLWLALIVWGALVLFKVI